MNILVTGSRGQLGHHLQLLAPQSPHHWIFTDVDELDITDRQAVLDYVHSNHIELTVNCAAFTDVERAEREEALALRINADAVGHLADAMLSVGGRLVHISTDYVFGGNHNNTPCNEQQPANPTGAYGRTKLAGEREALRCQSIVLRTSWLYSEYGRNFLLTMLRLTAERNEVRVVCDQAGTPTYAGDLANAISLIIHSGQYLHHSGIYHFSDEGVCSWYDFAFAIARLSGHNACRVLPCRSADFPSAVVRPAYSVLDKSLFKTTFHQSIPHWTLSLEQCLKNITLCSTSKT